MTLDDELRRALARKDPPDGFAERVIAGIERAPRTPRHVPRWRSPQWLGGIAALAASLTLAAGAERYLAHRREVREVERARRDVELALRIASQALHQVNTKLEAAFVRVNASEHDKESDRGDRK